jgi:glutamate synthase domain-containing protein 3
MGKKVVIDAEGMHYTPLNRMIRQAVADGADEIILENVLGQRFIANGLRGDATITVHGVPGGDLCMFMSGPTCIVHGNADHAPGNTMNAGKVVIHGSAGDAVAHSMRGGTVFIRDNIGYRGGIHMKQYEEKRPILVVGKNAQSFLGEYMAGGLLIVLGTDGSTYAGRGVGSGIHGGEIIIRGDVDESLLGVGAKKLPLTDDDRKRIAPVIRDFAEAFGLDPEPLINAEYTRIVPASARPFAGKYTWE